jgi:signal transduction histidine kinase
VELAEDLARRAALALDNARLYREAQEANRIKDEFLATVSHELRTPLNAMLGWARLLRTRQLDAGMSSHAMEVIERNALAQSKLIDDILDLSSLIRGKLRLAMRPTDLAPVLQTAIETALPAAEAKSIRLDYFPDPGTGIVLGDPDRLQQVFWNLLANAIKFTPEGGTVRIDLTQSGGNVVAQIIDNGRGIRPDVLPHIFERFRQGDGTTARRYGGLGMGLAIVRHTVELHGGSVQAESAGEGQGARFVVTLPLKDSRRPNRGAGRATQPGHGSGVETVRR